MDRLSRKTLRGKKLRKYKESQIEGHKDTERYSLSTPGYVRLMEYLHNLIPKDGKVLEIGCNCGFECMAMQQGGRKVIGIDIGEDFIGRAKEIGIDARTMDMHNLRFSENRFDCVYINNTLEHAYNPDKVLSEIYRVLKGGGKSIICIPADYKNKEYIPDENWDQSLHMWKPDTEEFNRTVQKAGFSGTVVIELDAKAMFGLENRASLNKYLVAICKK